MKIKIQHSPSEDELEALGVENWPIWEKEVSEFPWQYADTEVCYILEGEVTVTPEGGQPVTIYPGDLVTFPKGMSCNWKISKNIRKHYNFE
jgi:uncharacterized cupin superfamily protein